MRRAAAALAVASWLAAPAASALPIEWTFTGHVTSGELPGVATAGSSFRVSAIFDDATPDLCSDLGQCSGPARDPALVGEYALISVELQIGGVSLSLAGGNLYVGNEIPERCFPAPCRVRDAIGVEALFPGLTSTEDPIFLQSLLFEAWRAPGDSPGGPLGSDASPSAPSFEDWGESFFFVDGSLGLATGVIQTFSTRAVPEVGASALVALLVAAVVARGRPIAASSLPQGANQ